VLATRCQIPLVAHDRANCTGGRQRYYCTGGRMLPLPARLCRPRRSPGPHTRGKPRLLELKRRTPARDWFAPDLYGAFPCQGGFFPAGVHLIGECCLGLLTVLCSERERPFFIPSPAIRFAERAEGVKGPKR
jgi:hypothetical protein